MPRRVANGLTLLSAVVCVGSAMWVGRSWFRLYEVRIPLDQHTVVGAHTIDGRLTLWHQRLSYPAYLRTTYGNRSAADYRRGLGESWRDIARVRWMSLGWYFSSRQKMLILPLWLLPLLTAVAPVRWWRKRRRDGGRGFAVDVSRAQTTTANN